MAKVTISNSSLLYLIETRFVDIYVMFRMDSGRFRNKSIEPCLCSSSTVVES
jgi:hypothetical protein